MIKRIIYLCAFLLCLSLSSLAQHFQPVYSGNPFQPMNIIITSVSIYGEGLVVGDEIGIFDGSLCVGSYIVDGTEDVYSVVASADEPEPGFNGFTTNNPILIRIYKQNSNTEYSNLNPVFVDYDYFVSWESAIASINLEATITCSLHGEETCPGITDFTIAAEDFDDVDDFVFRINYNPDELIYMNLSSVNAALENNGTVIDSDYGSYVEINYTGSTVSVGTADLMKLVFRALDLGEEYNTTVSWDSPNCSIDVNGAGEVPANYISESIAIYAMPQSAVLIEGGVVQCETDTEQNIEIEPIPNAVNYNWNYSPLNAGTLNAVNNSPEASFVWADGYTGNATVTVSGSNICGTGPVLQVNLSRQPLPQADLGNDTIICSDQNISLSGTASDYSDFEWISSGTGSFLNANSLNPTYSPSPEDLALGSIFISLRAFANDPCEDTALATMELGFQDEGVLFAGNDTVICYLDDLNISSSSLLHGNNPHWTSSGTGTFGNANALHTIYYPSQTDIDQGWVNLSLTADSQSPCDDDLLDSFVLEFTEGPEIVMDDALTVCETVSDVQLSYAAYSQDELYWSGTGTGTFSDITASSAVYHPSAADIAAGQVTLTLLAVSTTNCVDQTSDSMLLSFSSYISLSGLNDQTICEIDQADLNPLADNYQNVLWQTSGSGVFNSGLNSLTNSYSPSADDIAIGEVELTLTLYPESPCEDLLSESISLSITSLPVVQTVEDVELCETATEVLLGGSVANADSFWWTSSGTGSFDNDNLLEALYTFSDEDMINPPVFTLHADAMAPCVSEVSDQMTVSFTTQAEAYAGEDIDLCSSSQFIPLEGATAANYSALLWTTSGSGTFTTTTELESEYIAVDDDFTIGFVEVYLTATSVDPCDTEITDTLIINLSESPMVIPAEDGMVCNDDPFELVASVENYVSLLWTTDGDGTFDDPTAELTTYYPGPLDQADDSIFLTMDVTPIFPCEEVENVNTLLLMSPSPEIVFPEGGYYSCVNYVVELEAEVNYHTNMGWSTTNGTGSFIPSSQTITNYYPSNDDFLLDSIEVQIEAWNTDCGNTTVMSTWLHFYPEPVVDAGVDQFLCVGDTVYLNAYIENYASFIWTTSTSGYYDEVSAMETFYVPCQQDYDIGYVDLALTVYPEGFPSDGCESVTDHVIVDFNQNATLYMGADTSGYLNDTVWVECAYANVGNLEWESPGDGELFPVNDEGFFGYSLGFEDMILGGTYVALTVESESPCSVILSDTVFFDVLTIGQDKIIEQNVKLWPNPANRGVTIEITGTELPYSLAVFDNSGRLLDKVEAIYQEEYWYSTAWLAEGIYYIQIKNQDQINLKKLIVKH
jgi:hypothetical protein